MIKELREKQEADKAKKEGGKKASTGQQHKGKVRNHFTGWSGPGVLLADGADEAVEKNISSEDGSEWGRL